MASPAELKYTASHEWVRAEADGSYSVGITNHAQEALGDIVFVEPPEVGSTLEAQKETAVIESVKAAGDLYAPAAGEVTAINDAVVADPASINGDPYGSWIFKFKPSDPAFADALMNAATYDDSTG